MNKIAIIGGGVSGLAAAHRITELNPKTEIVLLESSDRLGGVIRTRQCDGCLIESAADNFITSPPSAVELCQRLGIEDQLIGTNPKGRGAMVVRAGRLQPIPSGFLIMAPSRLGPLLTTPILGPLGKLRAAGEYFVRQKTDNTDESLQSFVSRRFGKQLFDRLVQPLVGGIYTADPARLSVAATMPRFLEMERAHGSLIKAMLAHQKKQRIKGKPNEQSSGARYGQFATLRGGMTTLVDSLSNRLPTGSIQLNSPVIRIAHDAERGWMIQTGGAQPNQREVDGIIIAAPAYHAAHMLADVDQGLAERLAEIEYASCAIISLAYRRDQIKNKLNSFGFVVPVIEKRRILSCSFSSIKYEARAPADTVLLRTYVGGAVQSDLLKNSDEQLLRIAKSELAQLLDISGQPIMESLTRQTRAMPQYHVGHLDRVAVIEGRLEKLPALAISGSSLYGVGVPACIASGEMAAERIVRSSARQYETKVTRLQLSKTEA
jgi:oxygen-dependent protoporphyrinogen oxidase